jgi:hypothetical protein
MTDFEFDSPNVPDLYDEIMESPWQTPGEDTPEQDDASAAKRSGGRLRLSKIQLAWAKEFDPLAWEPHAKLTVGRHLETIGPTSRRSVKKWVRIKAAVEAIGLRGVSQADFAIADKMDAAQLSRLLSDCYRRYPGLKPALRYLNLLNLHRKRRELSSSPKISLQGGSKKEDQDVDHVTQRAPYDDYPVAIKLAELLHEALPPLRSNYEAMIVRVGEAIVPEAGTLRTLWEPDHGDEIGERIDYKARLAVRDDNGTQLDAIDALRRLRQHADIGYGELDLKRALQAATDFFKVETIRKATIARLPVEIERPNRATPKSLAWLPSLFVDAPSSYAGDLGPTGREVRPPRVAKTYRAKITAASGPTGPAKGPRPLITGPLGRGKRSKPFATEVLNHGDPNANTRLAAQFPEPASTKMSEADWKHIEEQRLAARRRGLTRCILVAQDKTSPAERAMRVKEWARKQVNAASAQPARARNVTGVTSCHPTASASAYRAGSLPFGRTSPRVNAYFDPKSSERWSDAAFYRAERQRAKSA